MTDLPSLDFTTKRRIVLVGSMSVYSTVLQVAAQLINEGIQAIVPEAEDDIARQLSLTEFEQFKRRVSFAYLKKIRDPRTFCVLAVNVDRHGILNYIGPNTFAEIAVAFAQSKRVYLYQGIPDAYLDELSAWGSTALYGDLGRLVDEFREACFEQGPQMRLLE